MLRKTEPGVRKFQLSPTPDPAFLSTRVDTYYRERVGKPEHGGHILKGREPKEGSVILTSNDYLNIGRHPAIIEAEIAALQRNGHGVLRSDVFRGKDSSLPKFEQELAWLMAGDAAMVSQSGWCANVGLLQSIADERTPVFLDMYAHASLWEGARSAGAKAHPFKHNDPASLENLIQRHGPGVVAVDAVYSTSGSLCPLAAIVETAERYGCLLVVDESHSLGVFGDQGEGLCASEGLAYRVHFRTASLSKGLAARGGVIVGSLRNIEYLRYESQPAIFSSALLPHEAEGLRAALQVVAKSNWRRVQLRHNAEYLKEGLEDIGYNVEDSESQIISLVAGPERQTAILRDALESRGVFGSVFCAPATGKNHSLVRFSVNSDLKEEKLERVIAVCRQIRREVGMRDWASTRKRRAAQPGADLALSA